MAPFDLFGLKKGAPAPAAASTAAVVSPSPTLWKRAAMADAALLAACLGLAGWRASAHLSTPPAPAPVPHKAPAKAPEAEKPAPKKEEAAKPDAKKEEAPKAEPKKPEPKAEAKKEEPKKVPLGSPAIHAAPAPRRDPAPIGPAKAPAPAKAEAAPAAEAGKKKAATRPVPFSHEDSDAREVYLVGPFLVRSGGRKSLFKDSKGVWQTTVYLNIGQTYKYRFEVVGEKGKRLTAPQKVEVLDAD